MTLTITRLNKTKDYISGEFQLEKDGTTLCQGVTLELGIDKAIPEGDYDMKWRYSPHNKTYVPLLHNDQVSQERYIEIHVGNTTKDTLGCILVGERAIAPNHIINSRETFSNLQYQTKFEPFKIVVK